jgi:hypothetical protein
LPLKKSFAATAIKAKIKIDRIQKTDFMISPLSPQKVMTKRALGSRSDDEEDLLSRTDCRHLLNDRSMDSCFCSFRPLSVIHPYGAAIALSL